MVRATLVVSLLVFASLASPALGNGAFRKAPDVKVKKRQFVEEVYVSLFTHVSANDVVAVEGQIKSKFNSMPRNSAGGVQGAPLHYLAHTYFLKHHGWLVRGLDPHRLTTYNQLAKFFERDDFAAYLEQFIENVTKGEGFNLEFASAFIVVFKDFVITEGIQRLEDSYRLNGLSNEFLVSRQELQPILDSYLALRSNYASKAHDPVQHKQDLQSFFNSSGADQTHMLAQDVLQTAALQYKHSTNPFTAERWTFQQAQGVVKQMSRQYGELREQECQELKGALVELDPAGTGRVPLGQFYSRRNVGRWNLGESVEYLRQLGVLDESVPGRAPRVIIPNYITSVSNCEAVSMYFSLCCIHECEEIVGHFETHLQKPNASLSEILALVPSATQSAPRNLSSALVAALEEVASVHAGQVPLHGRLFAQWLHYVFPHECPYPHMSEKFRPLTPTEWFDEHGKEVAASQSDVDRFVQEELDAALRDAANVSDAAHLSQWTLDEEMSWDLHGRSQSHNASEAHLAVAKTFAKLLIMFAVFVFVVGGEMRRGYLAMFKTARGSKEADHEI